MFVRLSGLSFSYTDSVSTLSGVTLALAAGWTGVVGPNGSGKTTLLRLIAGELEPSAGHVNLDPPRGAIQVCAQTVEAMTPEIAAFARATDGVARRIHGELRLDALSLARWPTLSPGERKRWQVGAALASGPAVLMLDEPTDHLDVEARELLIAGLERFRGVGIIVSHDRALLDRITHYTVHVHDGTARIWRGGYSDAKLAWEAEEREHYAEYERLKHQRENLARRLADKRRLAVSAEAEANAGTRKRMKFRGDHDATSMLAKGKARMASERISRDAAVLRASVDRVSEKLGEYKFRKQKGRSIFVDYVPAPVAKVFTLDEAAICAGDAQILEDVHLAVQRDAKIRVAGPNGIGKTTLLAAMLRGAHIASRAHPVSAAGTHRARRYRDARCGPRTQSRRSRPRAHPGRVTWNRSRPPARIQCAESRRSAQTRDGVWARATGMGDGARRADQSSRHAGNRTPRRRAGRVPRRDGDRHARRRARAPMHQRRVAAERETRRSEMRRRQDYN